WRALLLRGYNDPPEVEELTTPPTADQLIVLVTNGSCNIESFAGGRWQRATYRPGHLGMTAPGESAKLRWRGAEGHSTLQLHLPGVTVEDARNELRDGSSRRVSLPNRLTQHDPVISEVMLTLERAARSGTPELYAETAAHFLAVHLLVHHAQGFEPPTGRHHERVLDSVDAYMRSRLSTSTSLAQLAEIAGLSRFQLLRAAKLIWGETPLRRLTRLRMELAQRLLRQGNLSVIEIALECGYSNPTHFAIAFKRHVGVTPSQYRQS
ncbi:MAG: helix-turn-helix transcriptional regulator, partial [Luteimonas sp.]|nr:helix-turn-helix transcriptional regulator [Luteimonas sp.]